MNIFFIVRCIVGLAICLMGSQVWGQSQQSINDLIEASQGEASPLIFEPSASVPMITPGDYYNEQECMVRKGMSHTLSLLQSGKSATIAFIGGSITQGEDGYRPQTAKFIINRYPNAKIKFLNAGISGTGTDLGACRISEQILKHNPDLIFIEFAVNGAYAPGMEGMVRQIIKKNPLIDICFIYTLKAGQTQEYAKGAIPDNIQRLEAIAAHYGVPSVHLGMYPALLEKQNKLIWKGDKNDNKIGNRILFSTDGIHPTQAGGNLYATAIARAIIKLEQYADRSSEKKILPQPLIEDNWENASMYASLDIAKFDHHWEKIIPEAGTTFARYRPWFPYLMKASTPGAALSFSFEGNAFGVFDIGGPEVGQLEFIVDSKPVKLQLISNNGYQLYRANAKGIMDVVNRFNAFCNNRYRGQYVLIELPKGKHNVTIRLSEKKADKLKILGSKNEDILANPYKYDQSVFYLGRILVRGTPIYN